MDFSLFLTNKQICTLFEGSMLVMRNVAPEGAVLMPGDFYCHQTTLPSLLQATFLSNIALNTGLQSAKCEFMFLFPHGVQVFLYIL